MMVILFTFFSCFFFFLFFCSLFIFIFRCVCACVSWSRWMIWVVNAIQPLHRQTQIRIQTTKWKRIDRVFFPLDKLNSPLPTILCYSWYSGNEWKFCRLLNLKCYHKFLIIDFPLFLCAFAIRIKTLRIFFLYLFLSENGASTSYPIRKYENYLVWCMMVDDAVAVYRRNNINCANAHVAIAIVIVIAVMTKDWIQNGRAVFRIVTFGRCTANRFTLCCSCQLWWIYFHWLSAAGRHKFEWIEQRDVHIKIINKIMPENYMLPCFFYVYEPISNCVH